MSDEVVDPLGDEIMGKGPRRRVNVTLPPRPDVPEETVEEGTRALAEKWKSTTQVKPTEPVVPAGPPPAPLVSSRFDLPDYLDEQLAIKAATNRGPSGGRITKTYVLLKALKEAGFRVDDKDLIEDRRRLRK
jgi:hypothetical protein